MIERVCATPWKGVNEIRRYLAWPAIRMYFAVNGVDWGRNWRVYGRPLIQRHAGSCISIGDGLHMRNWFSTNPLGVVHRSVLATWSAGSEIQLGDDINMTGTTICAIKSVWLGNRLRIGANSSIIDTDFHPLNAGMRRVSPREGSVEGVVIEDDVFIGMNALILKGTVLRMGTVVGAGSVVSGEFPPNVVIAGNPAQIVRDLS